MSSKALFPVNNGPRLMAGLEKTNQDKIGGLSSRKKWTEKIPGTFVLLRGAL